MPPVSPTTPIVVTQTEAARLLQVCPKTIFNLTREGKLRAVRIGRAIRYTRAEIDRFISSQLDTPTAA